MPRYNDPPTSAEMDEPPVVGLDCMCSADTEGNITLCPLHAAAPDLLAMCEAVLAERVNIGTDKPFWTPGLTARLHEEIAKAKPHPTPRCEMCDGPMTKGVFQHRPACPSAPSLTDKGRPFFPDAKAKP